MGSLGDYGENYLLDYLFSNTTYLAYSTVDPTDDGSGIAEPSGGSYARTAIPAATMGSAGSGAITNVAAITSATATGSWGSLTHFAIFDAATDGNMLVHGALTTPKSIDTGDTAQCAIGELDVTFA